MISRIHARVSSKPSSIHSNRSFIFLFPTGCDACDDRTGDDRGDVCVATSSIRGGRGLRVYLRIGEALMLHPLEGQTIIHMRFRKLSF